jgi:hypothetical protein
MTLGTKITAPLSEVVPVLILVVVSWSSEAGDERAEEDASGVAEFGGVVVRDSEVWSADAGGAVSASIACGVRGLLVVGTVTPGATVTAGPLSEVVSAVIVVVSGSSEAGGEGVEEDASVAEVAGVVVRGSEVWTADAGGAVSASIACVIWGLMVVGTVTPIDVVLIATAASAGSQSVTAGRGEE